MATNHDALHRRAQAQQARIQQIQVDVEVLLASLRLFDFTTAARVGARIAESTQDLREAR